MSACHFKAPPISVVYIYPVVPGQFDHYARRFVDTYQQFQPGIEHTLYVISNGGDPRPEMLEIFRKTNCDWLTYDNAGWDIGAYQAAARDIPCELMVCCGNSIYIRGPRWLERIADSVQKHGDALYGAMGVLVRKPHPGAYTHVRSTGMWFNPKLLNDYPLVVSAPEHRYPFEHASPMCFTQWVFGRGQKAWIADWSTEYEWPYWNAIPNGYGIGNQSGLILGDRLSEPPFYPHR